MLTGTKFGRYKILNKIGAGGMGEVYLARDEELDRNVALKVLLPEFCCDQERVQRFKLEAKAVSALNHPAIITIHEIGESGDRLYIATEFVDGETLREKIKNEKLSLLDSIKIAEQIADALAAAHAAHIIHRDIKPENVMIRRDGYVKILDFGLAKAILHKDGGTEDATIQMVKTEPGLVMGSVRYMSPEQARGKETNEKTDIWSLGVVLYEMITGKNPFEGETVSDSIAALIHVEPETPRNVPENLRLVIRKALRKNAAERFESIRDFGLTLKELRFEIEHDSSEHAMLINSSAAVPDEHDTSENKTLIHRTTPGDNTTGKNRNDALHTRAHTAPLTKKRWALPIGLLLAVFALAFGVWFFLPSLFGKNAPEFGTIQVSQLTNNGNALLATVSPDSKFVAFVANKEGKHSLFVRQISADSAVEVVPPTTSHFLQPAFSPDGQFIYYVTAEKGIGTLYRVATLGGQSKKIIYDIDTKVTVSPDGKQLAFIRHNPTDGGDTIFIAGEDGSNLQPFVQTKDVGYDKFTEVNWSPDNKRLLLGVLKTETEPIQMIRVAVIELADKKLKLVGEEKWLGAKSFEWTADGAGIVFIGRTSVGETRQIWHLSYPEGGLRRITSDTSDYSGLSVSADSKTIVATKADVISSLWSFAPASKELKQLTGESRSLAGHRGISQMPDEKILYSKITGKEINIFSMDENGGNEKQLTSESGFNSNPIATEDGRFIVFISNRSGGFGIWRMNADGSDAVQLTKPENAMDAYFQVAKDSKTVFFTRQNSDGGKAALMKISIEGGEAVRVFPDSQSSDLFPQISNDGKMLAYHTLNYDPATSNFNSSVKIAALSGGNVDKTMEQKEFPLRFDFKWSPDGKSLVYTNKDGIDNIWSISIADRKAKALTEFNSGVITNFTWSHDGKKLLIVRGIVNSDLILIKSGEKA